MSAKDPAISTRDPHDPGLVIKDGTPVSTRFDDVYFSCDGGLAETAHVFLRGCHLPDAWQRGRPVFTIAETGFGTGLNFLVLWDLWRRTRPETTVLHYLAVEGFPIPRDSLTRALAPFSQVQDLVPRLLAVYPAAIDGLHRLWFEDERVCLTLAIGRAESVLAGLTARVDAWFLDGFAPAKNPDMWSEKVFRHLARLSRPGATLASFTSAGAVRRGLQAVGFDIVKRPGFGDKRDCIQGRYRGGSEQAVGQAAGAPWFSAPEPLTPARVAIVGAGVAGASLAGALTRRGLESAWFDRRSRIGAEASGNRVGLLMPRPSLDDGGAGRLNPAAFRYAIETAARSGVAVAGNGVVELATDTDRLERFQAMAGTSRLDDLATDLVESAEAGRIAGVPLDRPALWHSQAGWIVPRDWTTALAGGTRLHGGCAVAEIQPGPSGWLVKAADGTVLTECAAVIIAAGSGAGGLLSDFALPLTPVRGQLSRLAETAASRRLAACLAYGGYLSPAIDGGHVAGATYDRQGFDPDAWPMPVRAADHQRTLDAMPAIVRRLFAETARPTAGRASLRAATPDRHPVAGPLATPADLAATYPHLRTGAKRRGGDAPPYSCGLFVLGGLGSRGLVTAPLLGELVAGQMLGEPWPVDAEMAAAVHPGRFAIRALRRRQR